MGKLLVFCSGKGGVGKSTVAAGMSIAAAEAGYSTLLIETDAGLRCLDLMLGVSDRLVFDLFDVVDGGRELEDATVACDDAGRLQLLSAPINQYDIDYRRLADFAAEATANFDYVMIDCPAGINKELYASLPRNTGVIVVTNPQEIPLRDADGLRRTIAAKTDAKCFLILNRFCLKDVKKGIAMGIDDAVDMSGVRLTGVVPDDKAVWHMDSRRYIKSRAAKAFRRIIKRIEGQSIPLPKAKKI